MKPQILRDHRTTDGGGGSRQEQERIQGIEETARRWRCPDDMVRTAIAEGLSEHEFGQRVMAFVAGQGSRGPAYPARNNDGIMRRDEGIGMSRSDMARYSIVKALRELAEGQRVSGLEREASDETARRMGIQPEGFFVPLDMMRARIGEQQRALSAGTDAAGGYTVETEVLGASLIELLRNRMVTLDLGARELMGLTSDIAIPTHTGAVTASWLAEAAADTASDQTFGQLTLTPKRISATTTISKQLIAQSSLDIESFVRRDMADTLAVELDHKALNGTGASNQPTGILNTSGIGTVTITAAGSPDWNEILEFESDVAAANADRGSLAYITTNAIRAYMKENLKVSADAGAGFLWDAPDRVNGYRAVATEQMPTNGILFGNFQDVLIASWGGLDVVVDPYTLKKNFQLEITTTLLADIGVRHAASFSKNA